MHPLWRRTRRDRRHPRVGGAHSLACVLSGGGRCKVAISLPPEAALRAASTHEVAISPLVAAAYAVIYGCVRISRGLLFFGTHVCHAHRGPLTCSGSRSGCVYPGGGLDISVGTPVSAAHAHWRASYPAVAGVRWRFRCCRRRHSGPLRHTRWRLPRYWRRCMRSSTDVCTPCVARQFVPFFSFQRLLLRGIPLAHPANL